ncbi:MAG: hypothetical protein HOK41_12870 [Nitrospina sp.]|jgi:hypothetical protein|nr:hypothetical protein [Nitrospina sp.]
MKTINEVVDYKMVESHKNGITTHEEWVNGNLIKIETYKKPELGSNGFPANFDDESVSHGTWTTWHDNGNKSYERTYNKGKLEGEVTVWNEDGSILFNHLHRQGKLISSKQLSNN